MTLLEDIITAMNKLGGHCYYKDLYNTIKILNPDYLSGYSGEKTWQASIRKTIELHSKDSKNFNYKHLFYSVEGIGKGHWGLLEPSLDAEHLDYTSGDEYFPEGKEILRKHLLRERNHYVKVSAIKNFKEAHAGRLYCEICGFDFYETYGDVGKDFIEAHHSKPISKMKENERTNIKDIVLLCSNCHSMIHRKRPWLQKNELQKLIKY